MYFISRFRKIIDILHQVHCIDFEVELGFIPNLPDVNTLMEGIEKMAQSDLAKKIDTDERLVTCHMKCALDKMVI